jgi:hypothetical protein
MKHPIHRAQRIVDSKGRHCGSLLYDAKGWHAHNAAGNRIGIFEDAERAMRKLCSLAQRL